MDLEGRLEGLALPPGKIVTTSDGAPALWVSDGPASVDLWRHVAGERHGLWPLVLGEVFGSGGPWDRGELLSVADDPDDLDPVVLLPMWWHEHGEEEYEDEVTAPFGRDWPGFAPAVPQRDDPDGTAFMLVESLLGSDPRMRLGLVAADRGADALASMGWGGSSNYTGTAEVVAVLRDWEKRFGARVVGLMGELVYLSVAAPPRDRDEALLVAAEHFALCPDNIWQSGGTVEAYAEELVGRTQWEFWWD